ncbi:hypothetical protein [Kitasatospora purpeofusca]|uniref:hypothetical protein n=1 Tax=Kitasatospora purpeofusca TaxID=67352 RepID=UPI00381803AF|nr:hypothetical protein KPHV_05180 [Kitasatospora purpeofusca]
MEMVFHRAEPKELREKSTVGVSGRMHPGVRLEPVDQFGEWYSVDARNDFEHAVSSVASAVEVELLAGHILTCLP